MYMPQIIIRRHHSNMITMKSKTVSDETIK